MCSGMLGDFKSNSAYTNLSHLVHCGSLLLARSEYMIRSLVTQREALLQSTSTFVGRLGELWLLALEMNDAATSIITGLPPHGCVRAYVSGPPTCLQHCPLPFVVISCMGVVATSNVTPLRMLYTYIALYWAQTYFAKAVALPLGSGKDCAPKIYFCKLTLSVWTGW